MQATGSRAPPSPRAPQLAPSAPPPQPSCQLRARAGAASASLAPARPGYYMATAHFRRRTSLSTRARPAGRMAHAHFACRGGEAASASEWPGASLERPWQCSDPCSLGGGSNVLGKELKPFWRGREIGFINLQTPVN